MDSGKIYKFFLILLIVGLVPFSASVSEVDVLVVNDGHRLGADADVDYNGTTFEDEYRDNLESISGVDVSMYRTNISGSADESEAYGPSAEYMSKFDTVIWYTLADYDTDQTERTLYQRDRENITEYLENGGSLYLNGHLIQFDLENTEFYQDILKTQYSTDNEYWRFAGDNLDQGLRYEWYDNPDTDETPVLTELAMDEQFDTSRDGVSLRGSGVHTGGVRWNKDDDWGDNWVEDKPDYITKSNYFSWRAFGLLYVPETENYEFNINSDDAGDVFVDGERVANYYGAHEEADNGDTSTKELDEGLHSFEVRMQDLEGASGVSVEWRTNDYQDFEEIPEDHFFRSPSWKYDGVDATSYQDGEMRYDTSGDVRLKGREGLITGEGFDFGLNTSIEPNETFGVISDICHNSQDSLGQDGDRSCSSASEALNWQNNISVSGGSDSYIHLEKNEKFDFRLDEDESSYYWSTGGRDSVIVVAIAFEQGGPNQAAAGVEYGGESFTELHNFEGGDGDVRTQLFYLENPPQGFGEVEIQKAGGNTEMIVNVLQFDGVDQENPIRDSGTSSGEADISTEVRSESGDQIIDFLVSEDRGMSPDTDYQEKMFELIEEDLDVYMWGSFASARDGSTSMGWDGDEDVAHTVLTLNEAEKDSKYYTEIDGSSPSSGDYPDELASGMVWAYPENYRTVHGTFGFEAIQNDSTQNRLMRNLLNYLIGPRTKDVDAYSGEDIPYTEVDESKYTKDKFNLTATGFNNQKDSATITNARFMVSNTSTGLEPVFEDGFEKDGKTDEIWNDPENLWSYITDDCSPHKGERSYLLGGDDSNLQSKEFDLDNQQNLSIEFWFKIPSSSNSCNAPDYSSSDILLVQYQDSGGTWQTLKELQADRTSAWARWDKISADIPDSALHDRFQVRLQKQNSDYDDILVDEVELDSTIEPTVVDSFYSEENVTVGAEGLDARSIEPDVGSFETGVNVTYGIQFKDGSDQGYWGKKGTDSLIVDTQAPRSPDISFYRDYTNESVVNIEIRHDIYSTDLMPNMTRFSCNQETWSDWYEREDTSSQTVEIDIASSELGCSDNTGQKTVYAEFRDYAGNKASDVKEDTIVYDTQKPQVEGIGPENNTAVRPSEEFIINASDNNSVLVGEKTVSIGSSDLTFENVYSDGTGQGNQSLTVNDSGGLDPFSTEGNNVLRSYIFDEALNMRQSYFEYDLDGTAPRLVRIRAGGDTLDEGDSLRPSEDLRFNVEDRNLDTVIVNEGSGNNSFSRASFTFVPGWSEGEKTLDVWMNDTAGNLNHKTLTYTVDSSKPYVERISEKNDSYILNATSISISFEDTYSDVEASEIEVSEDAQVKTTESGYDVTLEPVSDSEGLKSFNLTVPDSAGNEFAPEFDYVIDTVKPEVEVSYGSFGQWVGSNATVDIEATDDRNFSRINYCVVEAGDVCDLGQQSPLGENVSAQVSCSDGSACSKTVSYEAVDSAGNVNGTFESEEVLIDKKAPEASIQAPGSESTIGGVVGLEASISDPDSGVGEVDYSVYNASNQSQIFDSGTLDGTQGYSVEWDSTTSIDEIQEVVFNISASDQLGNQVNRERSFRVDNSQTSVTIGRPYRQYVDEEFRLIVDAQRPGTRNLEEHNYSVFDSSDNSQVSDSDSGLTSQQHRFNTTLEASELTGDGNYTLNSTAIDEDGLSASASAWFVMDTEAPKVSLEDLNGTWQTGTISIDFMASDSRENRSVYWRYSDDGSSWSSSRNLDFRQDDFSFNTRNCDDDSQSDCRVQLVAKDAAGNVNKSTVMFKVDNSNPISVIQSPEAGKWFNDSFEVQRSDTDNVAPLNYCEYRTGTGSWNFQSNCGQSFQVKIPEDCSDQEQNSCRVEIRTFNAAGLNSTDSREYSVDYEEPVIQGLRPESDIIAESDSFQVNFTDKTSEITYARWNASGLSSQELQNSTEFRPSWTESGEKTVRITLNDSADNLMQEEFTYTFDNQEPRLENSSLLKEKGLDDEVRIYRGEGLRFQTEISDNVELDEAILEINSSEAKRNISMRRSSGNLQESKWTAQVGERSEKGLYNITDLYIEDEAGNLNHINQSLPEFRVTGYELDVKTAQSVNANYSGDIGLEIDFNRTLGSKDLNLSIDSAVGFDVSNISCSYTGNCNISDEGSYWSLTVEGDSRFLDLSIRPQEYTPEVDTNVTFTSDISGNEEEADVLYRTPDLEISNFNCGKNCGVDQFENFTVGLEALNNDTESSSGLAENVSLNLEIVKSDEGFVERSLALGDISSGSSQVRDLEDISVSEVGSYTVEAVLEDGTEVYGDERSVSLEVADAEKPEVIGTTLENDRSNINGTVGFEARLEDNIEVQEANITVVNSSGVAENISLQKSDRLGVDNLWQRSYSKTSQRGQYNITEIIVNDSSGNLRDKNLSYSFKVSQLQMNATLLDNTTTVISPVEFSVNVTGNSEPISSIEINATDQSGDSQVQTFTEVGNTNTLSFSRFQGSGNHSFQVITNAGQTVEETTQDTFVQYGNTTVSNNNGNSTELLLPVDQSPYNLTWTVQTVNGGIRNADLEMTSSNTSVIEPYETEKNLGNLSYQQQKITGYRAGFAEIGTANLTMRVRPEKGNTSSVEVPVNVTSSDNKEPNISYVQTDDTPINLGEGLGFETEVTDNSILENVTLVIQHPENKSNVTEEFVFEGSQGVYSHEFGNTSEQGLYSYRVEARDIAGNVDTYEGNFTVTDELQADIQTDQETYVKEEDLNIDLELRDAGGEQLQDYNATAKLSKDGNNVTIGEGDGLSSLSYTIEESDPPVPSRSRRDLPLTYTIHVTVEKGPVTQHFTKDIEVTRILNIQDFSHTEFIEPGSNFTVATDWVEPGGKEIGGIFTSYAICNECPTGDDDYRRMSFNESMGVYTARFPAPNESDTISVRMLGSDNRGNSESQINAEPSDPAPSFPVEIAAQGTATNNTGNAGLPSGGLSGGSSGPSMEITRLSPDVSVPPTQSEINLSVNTNIAADCAYSRNPIPESVPFSEANSFERTGGVRHTSILNLEESITYSYSLMCKSDAANGTTDIIFSKGERELSAFQPSFPETLTPGNDSITQDSNGSGLFTVYNNQSEALDLQFEVESDCCEGTVVENGEEVKGTSVSPGEELGLSLSMYAPLYVEEGVHSATLTIIGENATRQRQISFDVGNNEEVDRFEELSQRADLLNSSISRYRIAGIDTSRMRKAFGNLTEHLDEANNSIQANDLEGLKTALDEGEEDADRVDQMLEDASFKKFVLLNWWKWALGFVIVYIGFFLVVMVGIPYYRIKTELTRVNSQLESATEARKKGEKQYFQRKIDKDTFNQMMTERQNEVLELRGEKEDLKEELDGFLRGQLTLENYIKAPSKGLDELGKWWAANKKARENLKEGDGEDSE